jgi:hypothetical protein
MADMLFMFIQMVMVLATWSYLYRDNFFSKAAAEIVISVSTVYFFLSFYDSLWQQAIVPILDGTNLLNIIPIILGLLMFSRLFKGYGWVSSYSYAILLGLGTGATLTTMVQGSITTRISDTVTRPFAATLWQDQLGAWLTVFGVIFSLSYWLFTIEYKGYLAYSLKIGRLFLMCSIGMLYAEDVLWSQSLFTGAATIVVNFFKVALGIPI